MAIRQTMLGLLVLTVPYADAQVTGQQADAVRQIGKENPFETGWGKPVNPENDCKFLRERGGLTIELPNRSHTLPVGGSPSPRGEGLKGVPLLLRNVTGDFVVQVRVAGTCKPTSNGKFPMTAGWAEAGLIVMADKRNFVRLAWCCHPTLRGWSRGPNWGEWKNGWCDSDHSQGGPGKVNRSMYLRLERKGRMLLAAYSHDGNKWQTQGPSVVCNWPANVKLGLMAEAAAVEAFKPHFDNFKLVVKPTQRQ
ncbi:MAG TPA: DUF1349 domain-containing protein [Gemmataceae bacterium]|nr:DUF1349 domain-containing protein [Gemmataceae bacterium]